MNLMERQNKIWFNNTLMRTRVATLNTMNATMQTVSTLKPHTWDQKTFIHQKDDKKKI